MKFLLAKTVMVLFLASLISGYPTVVLKDKVLFKSNLKHIPLKRKAKGDVGCVTFWSAINKIGTAKKICGKTINLDEIAMDNDASSFEINAHTYVQMCTGKDLRGDCIQYIGPIYINDMRSFYWAGINKDYNDKIRSVKASSVAMGAGCWVLYEHMNFRGKELSGCESKANLMEMGFNDQASSYRLAASALGEKITLYKDINFGNEVDTNLFDEEKAVACASHNKDISAVQVANAK